MTDSRAPRNRPPFRALGLVWLVLGFWYAVILWSVSNLSPAFSLLVGYFSIAGASALGILLWRFTGRFVWSDTPITSFLFMHVLAGLAFTAMWVGWNVVVDALLFDVPPGRQFTNRGAMTWILTNGVWIFLVAAGAMHAMRYVSRFRQQQQELVEARAMAAEAQVAALRARLNPHFLFNALHSVSALVRYDAGAAEEAIDRLGGLLRYTLSESNGELIPLESEWSFTMNYLEMEKLRYGNRLRVEAEIDQTVLDCEVPALVLQPLVENAVKHAVAPLDRECTIRVLANQANGHLVLSVEDEGPGIDLDDNSRGVGLDAIRGRLSLLYGDRASFGLTNRSQGGTVARVEIPLEEAHA